MYVCMRHVIDACTPTLKTMRSCGSASALPLLVLALVLMNLYIIGLLPNYMSEACDSIISMLSSSARVSPDSTIRKPVVVKLQQVPPKEPMPLLNVDSNFGNELMDILRFATQRLIRAFLNANAAEATEYVSNAIRDL